jgi:hypothetical protein
VDEKKSESSWGEAEQVGPYQLQEQVPQSEYSRGELYRATHETSGATALVLKPSAEDKDGAAPLADWRVRIISSDAPGYLALEVEHSPKSVAPDSHSVEALVVMLEDVREGVRRMTHAFSDSSESRLRRCLGMALVSAATVCALVFALTRLAPMSQPPSGPDSLARLEPAPLSHEVPTDTLVPLTEISLLRPEDGGLPALFSHPLPNKPYKGQKRPPCKPRVEVEINGGCWVPHKLKAPCPEDLYEYQGECYTVSMQPPSTPQSLGQ